MSAAATAYRHLLAAVLFLFLLLSDWVIFNGPLLSIRHGLLVALTLALLRLALAIKLIASLVLGFVAPKGGAIVTTLANRTLAQRHAFGGPFSAIRTRWA